MKNIYILLGTKGQFIKMAPVLKELDNRKINYRLVHTNQHTEITRTIIRIFNLKSPDCSLVERKHDVIDFLGMITWFLKALCRGTFKKNEVFNKGKGIIILHGDTQSTLLGLLLSKIHGMQTVHIEAGLRSNDIFNPFPEEIIRRIVSKYSDYLFAPNKWAYNNLRGLGGERINTLYNTVFDSINTVIEKKKKETKSNYVFAAIHRTETLLIKKRLDFIVKTLEKVSYSKKVFFVLHSPTKRKLKKYGFYKDLDNNKNIFLLGYLDYKKLINLVAGADFVVTDGGGIQEETYFLNVPCLIMRNKTERLEGLTETAFISDFNEKKVNFFVDNYKSFKRKRTDFVESPSKIIVRKIEKIITH